MSAALARRLAACAALAATCLSTGAAHATSVLEIPENGSEQLGRGGAWLARASDPLATFYNPAGLAGQGTGVTLQANLVLQRTCFDRVRAASDTSTDPLAGADGTFPGVCNDVEPNPIPSLGATFRVTPRLTVGALFVTPHSAGSKTFPEFVEGPSGPEAAPQRYLSLRQRGVIAFPSLGVGYEIVPGLRVGGSFHWGFAKLKVATTAVALNADGSSPANDVRTNLQVADYFVPGFTLGGLWSATEQLDVAVFYRLTDAVRARGDLGTAANYFSRANASGDDRGVRYGDTIFEDCGTGQPIDACGQGKNARFTLGIPMEAKVGVRFHQPRVRGPVGALPAATPPVRDPLSQDAWDVELDAHWAHNSAANPIEVRFPADEGGNGVLPVSGIPGGQVPPRADQDRGFRDSFGLRAGGDWAVVPSRVALRGGAFVDLPAQADRYQALDFSGAARFGFALGGTLRVPLRDAAPAGDGTAELTTPPPPAIDVMLGYGHVFFVDQTNRDPNATGLTGQAGTACNPSSGIQPGATCAGGAPKYRTNWPVNLGTVSNDAHVLSLGVAYRFF